MATKVYVKVIAEHDTDGTTKPISVTWKDGIVYEIDCIKQIRRAASTKVGGTGVRYTIRIGNNITFLFDEENGKWFVESKN